MTITKKRFIYFFLGILFLAYFFMFVGFYRNCGCGYKFVWSATEHFNKYCSQPKCFEVQPMTPYQQTVNRILLKPVQTKFIIFSERKINHFVGMDKCKLGIKEFVLEYKNDGQEAAKFYAKKTLGIDLVDGKMQVKIFTKGKSSDLYSGEFGKLSLEDISTSSLNNISFGLLTAEEISLVSKQDFVIFIQPESQAVAD